MKQKPKLDMDKIAKHLGAERRGEIRARSGVFAASQLVADVQARFRTPAGGGRSTDPSWTERRLIPLAPETLERLESLARTLSKRGGAVTSLQVAALLLQRATENVDDSEIEALAKPRVSTA